MIQKSQKYDFIVVGGGVYGLSATYFLAKTNKKVALIDQFQVGHLNGSSHGPSRIMRSYEYELFRDLNKLGLEKYWPEMEEVLDYKFVYKNDFVLYEDDSQESYEKFVKESQTSNGQIIISTSEKVSQVYENVPLIKSKFPPVIDKRAAMIAADDYILKLYRYLRKQKNVDIFQDTPVKNVSSVEKAALVETEKGNFKADKVLLACGRWISNLVPEMKKITTVCRQLMGYFQMKDEDKYQFGKFPSIRQRKNQIIYYAIPDRKNLGLKIGEHVIANKDYVDDTEERIKMLNKKADEWFGEKIVKMNKIKECYYTCTKTEEFIIDWADPGQDRILVCSCCSGHGFKFGPIIGDIVSDLLKNNKSIDLFEKYRHTFQIPYHQGINLK